MEGGCTCRKVRYRLNGARSSFMHAHCRLPAESLERVRIMREQAAALLRW
jgi:hypothetical protein